MPSTEKRIVIIGSGTAGLNTALGLAGCGAKVTLVEQQDKVGGNAANWACMATTECAKCGVCLSQDLRQKALSQPNIDLIQSGELTALEGEKGNFTATIQQGSEQKTIKADGVVLSTGFTPYDAGEDKMLGYGLFPGVITTKDLDDVLREDDLAKFLPDDLEKPRIAFIQCVGSRNMAKQRDYCSQFCCKNSIRQTQRLKYLKPEAKITIFYIDLQIMGKGFKSFLEGNPPAFTFIQGTPAEVVPESDNGPYRLYTVNPEDGQTTPLEFDRIVLAVGVAKHQGNQAMAEKLNLELDNRGFFKGDANRSTREGIYLAGACAGPTNIPSALAHSLAAVATIRKDLSLGEADDSSDKEPRIIHQFV